MKQIIMGVKLLFMGIYIELLRSIVQFLVKIKIRKKKVLSSSLLIFISILCGKAGNRFISMEEKYLNL